MSKSCRRSIAVLLCMLTFSVCASAEVFTDFVTKVHDWYVGIAAVLSIMLLVVIAFRGYASEHNRWSIWIGGFFMVLFLNIAGKILVDWIPAAT